MIRLALYLTFGVVFEGPQIDPANAWTWVWIFGWPLALILLLAKWLLVIAVGIAVVSFIAMGWERVR